MRRHVWWLAGLVLVVGGAWWAFAHGSADDFGWFAYTPTELHRGVSLVGLSLDSGGHLVLVTRGTLVGLAVAVTGLLLLAGWLGFRLGRRRTASAGPRA